MVNTKLHPHYVILCPRYKSEVSRTIQKMYHTYISDIHYLHMIVSGSLANYH